MNETLDVDMAVFYRLGELVNLDCWEDIVRDPKMINGIAEKLRSGHTVIVRTDGKGNWRGLQFVRLAEAQL